MTTTFVTGYTDKLSPHPGAIPNQGSSPETFDSWDKAWKIHETDRIKFEVKRKFSGRASDKSIKRWASTNGVVGEVSVHVVTHSGHIKYGAFTESKRTLNFDQ